MTVVASRKDNQSPNRRISYPQPSMNPIMSPEEDMGNVLQDDYEKRKLITFTNTSNR